MTACGHRVRFARTWREGFFEVPFSYNASFSADGRYVAFTSDAFVPGDTNNRSFDVFVRDLQTGAVIPVSTTADGGQVSSTSDGPSISDDGRYVAFYSLARDLVAAGDTNGSYDVFVRDLQTGAITRVSGDANGDQGNGDSQDPSISAGGLYVAFTSAASNLVADDTNGASDVFVRTCRLG
jgi:Tol biopolymer transport system component